MVTMDKLVSLCKRRGIIYQSSEIYGGLTGCWDYGPVGAELKQNIRSAWWYNVVQLRSDVVGLDASIIMHSEIWRASGHVESFKDSMVDCKACKHRFREDHLEEKKCPDCGGELTEARPFNLMFKTYVGAVEDEAAEVYLRPETAQAIFAQFHNVLNSSRRRVPFGIGQIGKAFRNEVTPRNFVFRSREFEQMELEYFVSPSTAETWNAYWINERLKWYESIGINRSHLRVREHTPEELAHYAKSCVDIEYEFPFGWQELEGIANRTDFDLSQHEKHSGKSMLYKDEVENNEYIPHVIESSAGVDRILLTLIAEAYHEEEVQGEQRVVLRFARCIAPIKVGIFPLMKKPPLAEKAKKIEEILRPHFTVFYDEIGSIGRRYRRLDEIGTPCCVTIDFQTLDDNTVTIRDRDSMQQERVNIDALIVRINELLEHP